MRREIARRKNSSRIALSSKLHFSRLLFNDEGMIERETINNASNEIHNNPIFFTNVSFKSETSFFRSDFSRNYLG